MAKAKKAKRAKVRIKVVKIQCAFCGGTGKDPFEIPSKLSNCQTCLGRGWVYIEAPHMECPACHGTGHFRDHLNCAVCGGKGRVRKYSFEKYRDGIDPHTGLPHIRCYKLKSV